MAVGLEGADKREDVRRGVCGWWTIVIGNLRRYELAVASIRSGGMWFFQTQSMWGGS